MEKKGISGSTLKLIAVVTMVIDHTGAFIIGRIAAGENAGVIFGILNNVMRGIGRISFPIFCFLLVEGFMHTKNIRNYAMRLFLFALLSEIPFNLAFSGKIFYPGYQNVFFTLLIGLLVMYFCSLAERLALRHRIPAAILFFAAVIAGMSAAEFLRTDYASYGIFCIMILYLFRNRKKWQEIAGILAFLPEFPAPLAFLPIHFYNGNRGLSVKYLFYIFYPFHLLILYLAAYLSGLVNFTLK